MPGGQRDGGRVGVPGGVHQQPLRRADQPGVQVRRQRLHGLSDHPHVAVADLPGVQRRAQHRQPGRGVPAADRVVLPGEAGGADPGGGVAGGDPQRGPQQHPGGGDRQLTGQVGVVDLAGPPHLRRVHRPGDALQQLPDREQLPVLQREQRRVPQRPHPGQHRRGDRFRRLHAVHRRVHRGVIHDRNLRNATDTRPARDGGCAHPADPSTPTPDTLHGREFRAIARTPSRRRAQTGTPDRLR